MNTVSSVGNKIESSKHKGFTIIEVVLVLAIAGLIFLVVFTALPQLQRSRRDSQRQSDLRLLLAELEAFPSNTIGNSTTKGGWASTNFIYPFLDNTGGSSTYGFVNFCEEYMYEGKGATGDHDWKDPTTGTGYTCSWTATDFPSDVGRVHYSWRAKCDGEDRHNTANNTNDIAVSMELESGRYCLDNS